MSRRMEKRAGAFRTIREVADWLGVPTHVLRFWESKFDQVSPTKGAGGRRYYRPEDMQLLGGIKVLLHDQGQTIRGVAQKIDDEGIEAVTKYAPELGLLDAPKRSRKVIRKGDTDTPEASAIPNEAPLATDDAVTDEVGGPSALAENSADADPTPVEPVADNTSGDWEIPEGEDMPTGDLMAAAAAGTENPLQDAVDTSEAGENTPGPLEADQGDEPQPLDMAGVAETAGRDLTARAVPPEMPSDAQSGPADQATEALVDKAPESPLADQAETVEDQPLEGVSDAAPVEADTAPPHTPSVAEDAVPLEEGGPDGIDKLEEVPAAVDPVLPEPVAQSAGDVPEGALSESAPPEEAPVEMSVEPANPVSAATRPPSAVALELVRASRGASDPRRLRRLARRLAALTDEVAEDLAN